jgi:hypothetical protein
MQALPSIEALIDFAGGNGASTPLLRSGYSNATLSRVKNGERTFVLKHTTLNRDWTAQRSGDARGREALLLSEAALAPVWEVFACPYIAYATGPGEVGLLMHDLTDGLLPDAREPLTGDQEAAILERLAALHARFWGARAPEADWLADAQHLADMLAPSIAADDVALAMLPPVLRESVPRGWEAALRRVPAGAREWLTCSGSQCARQWQDLPRTLVHGDVKVANFALPAEGGVAAFDWATAGVGPCSVDRRDHPQLSTPARDGARRTVARAAVAESPSCRDRLRRADASLVEGTGAGIGPCRCGGGVGVVD